MSPVASACLAQAKHLFCPENGGPKALHFLVENFSWASTPNTGWVFMSPEWRGLSFALWLPAAETDLCGIHSRWSERFHAALCGSYEIAGLPLSISYPPRKIFGA